MKIKYYILSSIIVLASTSLLQAQHINTMYFLENTPLRHTINPAFQPVSKIYITLPVLGYTSLAIGNKEICMQDLIFTNESGETITALHPCAEGQLWNKLPKLWNSSIGKTKKIHNNLIPHTPSKLTIVGTKE